MLIGALLLGSALIGASQLGARTDRRAAREPAPRVSTAQRDSLIAGVAQNGAALGSPMAPVTLVEYADLQCPYCAEWARQTLPVLVADYVRTGKLRIVFRGLAFLGPDSRLALETAIAAGREDRLWNVVHALYEAQGLENSGWVTDVLLSKIAAGAGLDYRKLAAARSRPGIQRELVRSAEAATTAGVQGTPSFAVGTTGGRLRLIELGSLGPHGVVPAIEAALRGE